MKPQLVISKYTGLIVQTDEDWHLINFNGFFSGTVMFVPEGRTDIKAGDHADDFIIEKFVPYSGDVDIPLKHSK